MKIAQYVETFSYVGMFNTMNFASYSLYLISPFMQHPVEPAPGPSLTWRAGEVKLVIDHDVVGQPPLHKSLGVASRLGQIIGSDQLQGADSQTFLWETFE